MMITFTGNQETRTHNYNCYDMIIIRMEHSLEICYCLTVTHLSALKKKIPIEIGTTYQQVHAAESRLIGVFQFSCEAAAVRPLQNM